MPGGGIPVVNLLTQFGGLPAVIALLATVLLYRFYFTRHVAGAAKAVKAAASDGAVKGKGEEKIFTLEEVAKHDKDDDCWIIIKGKVYDVSQYVIEHPGGDAILNNAGGDSTEGFLGPQHPNRVFDEVEAYCIGKLAP